MDHADAVPLAELLDERRYLLDVGHRMLGGPGAAESVVEETYRRWYGLSDAERRGITTARAWLGETAGGICRSRLTHPGRGATGRSEGRRTEPGDAEGARARLTEAVGRDRTRRSRPTPPEEHDALARAVRRACVGEDAELLASLLCPDATAFFDGGGRVRALIRPVHGRRRVTHSLLTLLARHPRTTLAAHPVNGRTGLVARYDGQVAAVIGLDIADHHVARVWAVLNPEKLRSWNGTAEDRDVP
ncbi:RNA polymerase subunit sigma [Streptomyces sp. PRKS01-29]|nr:RNA polymerase subunit sigma [Streptomyces sabulosicollis]MBI0300226.1 RNA polymerase subunit sigma [Streptomyces sabulosicollis]